MSHSSQTTELMRKDLHPLLEKINDTHAGLLIQKGLKVWENNDTKKKLHSDGKLTDKETLINTIANVTPTELYKLAFERWLVNTYHAQSDHSNQNFAHVSGQVIGRLYTGLALGGTLETGVMTHHTYGMPMIAGSSIKGAVRNYAELLFAKRDELGNPILTTDNKQDKDGKEIQRIEIDSDKQKTIDVLFGTGDEDSLTDSPDNAGYIIWHDAWWIPVTNDCKLKTGNDSKPFVDDIVTVHHQQYYNGGLTQALDMESPVPNQQLAVQGGFYFTVEGNGETEEGKKWLKLAKDLLIATIENQGLGAKSSSGYGYFELDSRQIDDMMEEFIKKKAEAEKQEKIRIDKENSSPLMRELIDAIAKNNWDTGKQEHKNSFTAVIDDWLDKLESHKDDRKAIDRFIETHKLFFENHWTKKPKKNHLKERVQRMKALQRD